MTEEAFIKRYGYGTNNKDTTDAAPPPTIRPQFATYAIAVLSTSRWSVLQMIESLKHIPAGAYKETSENITLAIRHLEDCESRISKAIERLW